MKVAVCAGHGHNTAGKRSPDGEREWDFNDKVVDSLIKHLQFNNIQVLRTDDPTGVQDIPLKTRTDKANAWGADIYISCHHNANTGSWGSWTGTETFTYLGSNPKSEKLAGFVHPELLKAYGLKDRGLKKADFHIVRETKMPAILIEGGYMDSTIDIKKLRDDKVLAEAGRRIAIGVCAYFGVSFKEQPITAPAPQKPKNEPVLSTSGLYRVYVDGVKVGAFKDPTKAIEDALKKSPKELKIERV